MKYILVGSTDEETVRVIRSCFDSGYKVETATSRDACLELFNNRRFEFLFIDIEMLRFEPGENDYKKHLQPFWRISPDAEIIVLSSQSMIRQAVSAVKAGASNYLTYPLSPEEVKYVLDSLQEYIRFHSELDYLRNRFWRSDSLVVLRTNSPVMKELFAKVRAVAQTESTVLLTGETGTGKGVIAKLIHQHSKRSEHQFISVHCGAIPDTLLESELFGHEKGAFTGAVRRKLGKFEIAHGGTIFLDEIGTISSAMQINLLQILQEKTFQRVGGEAFLKADVRIIAATNSDLKRMCHDGTFREDLYYRLNVFPLEVPPLRERMDDIPLLAELFIQRLDKSYAKNIRDIHPEALQALLSYSWPGNIRELENLIERAYILETSSILTPKSFPIDIFQDQSKKANQYIDTSHTLEQVRQEALERIEKHYLIEVLAKYHGKIKETAKAAGIGERQLHKLLRKHRIHKEDFKAALNST